MERSFVSFFVYTSARLAGNLLLPFCLVERNVLPMEHAGSGRIVAAVVSLGGLPYVSDR